MDRTRILALLAGVCAAAVGGSGAFAQTPATSSAGNQLEEVVVTAERREERLQDVPVSVTAFNTQRLEAKQVTDVLTLSKVSGGLVAKPTLSSIEINVSMRGIAQQTPAITSDPAIGTYVDGVYNVLNAGSNNAMIDMERVEILKGPQGTLFGRNTLGGAISITTAPPVDQFGGYVEGKLGNYDARTATGVVNLPIVSGLLDTRIVYQHTEHGGYGKDLTTNTPTNSLNQDYVRGALKFTPSDKLQVLGSAFYTKSDGYAAGSKLAFFNPTTILVPGLPPSATLIPRLSGAPGDSALNYIGRDGFRDSRSGLPGTFRFKQYGATGTITSELNDLVTVKSITGFTKTYYTVSSDFDGTPYVYLDLFAYPERATQISEEFQVYGDALDGRLKWIGGVYYFQVTGSQVNNVFALQALRFLPTLAGGPAGPLTHTSSGPDVKNTSSSAFAQISYEILPKVRLTGGIRYVTDKRRVTYHDDTELGAAAGGQFLTCSLANAPLDTNPTHCSFVDSVTYHFVPWTVGLDYKPTDDALLYAKVSKGYRSGAFGNGGPQAARSAPVAANNARVLATFGPSAPESLISYDAGAKLEFLDHRLRINTAAYWSKYTDIQLTTPLGPDPACPTCSTLQVVQNSGTAEIWGGELEVTALIQKLQVDATLGYAHPKYVAGPNLGTDLINVAKLSYSLGGSYPIETSAGVLTLGATYSYRSKVVFFTTSALASGAAAAVTQKGYGQVDARAAFAFSKLPITVAVFGQNLANKKYNVAASALPPPFNFAVTWPGAPRTYGVSLKYDF
jgi:iron complex outermembrane receptor protein